ncbi:MAG: hypothetical protein QOJ51_3441 [Acidobacteriaceae bacterium]|nr:hypothetical protein [Acidobacteriaceae bacterium]
MRSRLDESELPEISLKAKPFCGISHALRLINARALTIRLMRSASHPTSIHDIALIRDRAAVVGCQKQYQPGHIVRHYLAF